MGLIQNHRAFLVDVWSFSPSGLHGEAASDNSCLVQWFRYCPDPLGIVTAKQFAK
jgi:hypothetical protein